jgi:Flp pilus assembly secretin CpaC
MLALSSVPSLATGWFLLHQLKAEKPQTTAAARPAGAARARPAPVRRELRDVESEESSPDETKELERHPAEKRETKPAPTLLPEPFPVANTQRPLVLPPPVIEPKEIPTSAVEPQLQKPESLPVPRPAPPPPLPVAREAEKVVPPAAVNTAPLPPAPALELPAPSKASDPGPRQLPELPQVPAASVPWVYGKFVDGFVDPSHTLDLIQGRPYLLKLKQAPKHVLVSAETILTAALAGNQGISLHGQAVGSAVVHLEFPGGADSHQDLSLSLLVRVNPDPEARGRYDQAFHALQNEINRTFEGSQVQLKLLGDAVLVTGQAKDFREATQILHIVVANTPWAAKSSAGSLVNAVALEQKGAPAYLASGSAHVINMLRIAGTPQVMLNIVVAEMPRTTARRLCAPLQQPNRPNLGTSTAWTARAPSSAGNATVEESAPAVASSSVPSAMKWTSGPSALAEPKRIALNGEPALLLGGGQFPLSLVAGRPASEQSGIAFMVCGVQLNFTPDSIEKDSLRLHVTASGMAPAVYTADGRAPTVAYTAELREGQTCALPGLIPPSRGSGPASASLFGKVPLINRLSCFDRVTGGDQEVVIFIEPDFTQVK